MDPIFRLLYYSEQFQKNSASNHAMTMLSKNLHLVPGYSISEMADVCSTNPMTLSRIVRKLGYSNYAEFRTAAMETLSNYRYFNRNIPVANISREEPERSFLNYLENRLDDFKSDELRDQLRAVCEVLHNAESVHYYGPPFSSPYMLMLFHDLLVDGKLIYPNTSEESIKSDIAHLDNRSVVFIEPNDLSTSAAVVREIIDSAQKKKAVIVMHTWSGDPILSYVQGPNLCYKGDHTAFSVMESAILINMLTILYRSRYIEDE